MTELKATPGPWSVARSGWDENTGDVWYSLEGVKTSCIADARLIAAAPDLLEALCMLLDCVNTYAPEYMHGLPKKDYTHKALAALSKARGES